MRQADPSQQKIMVVDNNSKYVRLIERILQINSYQNILSITDPMKAVTIYNDSRPDLLLINIEMPDIDGFEVLKMLHYERQDEPLPVIMFSDQTDGSQKAKALEFGVQDVIAKPFSQREIVDSVNRFFKQHSHLGN